MNTDEFGNVIVDAQISMDWIKAFPNELPLIPGTKIPRAAYDNMMAVINGQPTPQPQPQPTPTPQPNKSLAARSIGPFGVPAVLLYQLWKLREKWIKPEVHRRIHPLV